MPNLSDQLDHALDGESALLDWFASRGWAAADDPPVELPSKQILTGAEYLEPGSSDHANAPRILFLWRDSFSERSVYGQKLRNLQKEANRWRDLLVANGFGQAAPNLCAVGCEDFLIFFPLDGDPFARRLRFTPAQLEGQKGDIAHHFEDLDAATMAEWLDEGADNSDDSADGTDDGSDLLADIIGDTSGPREYDFSELFVGVQLDDAFVAFMGQVRRHVLGLVLDPPHREDLLVPVLETLLENARDDIRDGDWETASDGLPTYGAIAKIANLRNRIVAVVDTVLLRLVLYRYLEAQFDYDFDSDEASEVAYGSYDEILDRTTRVDSESLDSLLDHARKAFRSSDSGNSGDASGGNYGKQQLGLFEEAVEVTEPEDFEGEVRAHHEFYQGEAGGDLHQGEIAEAADVLQGVLLREHKHEIAALLEGTRSDRYSFHYADLDPRAFQRFYEDTIGTDIRLDYQPAGESETREAGENGDAGGLEERSATRRKSNHGLGEDSGARSRSPDDANAVGIAEDGRRRDRGRKTGETSGTVDVGVVYREKNRKEQGAFYTHEKMAQWLVERSLGRLWEDWKGRFLNFLQEEADEPAGRLPKLRCFLDELLDWRIIDPTCGGGIFLRTAFEYLAKRRAEIEELLEIHLPEVAFRELTDDEPYAMFRTGEGEEPGEWQWYVLLNMLYGVDKDVKAINVASNLLTLSAITYKRHGVSFPSFINVNLKRGNALVVPLKPDQREAFAEAWGDQIRQLIELRRQLRDPRLPRDEWRRLHAEASELASQVLHAQIVLAFDDVFPELENGDLIRRVLRVGAFLYEIEFPEVFFNDDGTWKDNPGFDVVLGNPPWEEPAKEYKQFLPEFDPQFAQLKGKAAKQREDELLADPEIQRRWEAFQDSIDDYKALLDESFYEYQQVPVDGEVPSAHRNLYKYATELAYKLLQDRGKAGLVLDTGLWNDVSAKGLRMLLLDESQLNEVCGFTNKKQALFGDVHPSYKFSTVTFESGSYTDFFRAIFMRRTFDALDEFDEIAVRMEAEAIRGHRSDAYPVAEIRSDGHWHAKRALEQHPSLSEQPWSVDTYSREFNAGEQRHFFNETRRDGFFPLVEGTQFNLFGVHQGEPPALWLDPSEDEAGGFLRAKQEKRILLAIADWLGKERRKKAAGREWLKALTGEPEIPDEWMKLDWDGYRIAWRDIARNDDTRTLIPAIIPPKVGLSHTAPFIRTFRLQISSDGLKWVPQYPPRQLLYLAGMLSSFACDSLARSRVAKTHLTATTFRSFEVPEWQNTPQQRRVAELCARLTCLPADDTRPWADYTDLAATVGLTPDRDGLTDPDARREAEVELNALACQIYGLEPDAFRFLMNELFMTPEHRGRHERMRDEILKCDW